MPRASDGAYSLPSGSLVSVGEDIVPSQHNPPLTDIAQALSDSLSRDGRGGMRSNLDMGGFKARNLAPGTQPTDAATVGQITGLSGVPVGSMMDWAAASPPTGWLICAGQSLSRAAYPDLFAVLGTTFGASSASVFNLPDLRGRVVAGLDVDSGGYADRLTSPNSRTLGAAGGSQTVTLTEAQMPVHTHEVSGSTNSAGAHSHSLNLGGGTNLVGNGLNTVPSSATSATGSSGAHSHTIEVSAENAGGGEAHANVQPTIILNKIIKSSSS
ncbi:phage tail protein [Sphingopyxis sp. 113P3]|uniref:phage tail protein n=1 Tax=Sphingopyxis sp. (strain 113P3) TaxID=292913 RepID=UPI0006AD2CFC|nr:tail fiber protein [Sphingopyxis sp. 113P3]ALC11206.1 microcystin-dependent protein-like protein [Sphingopyxis sp. 113P3]